MIMWAVGFPAAEVLLETWGAVSLAAVRLVLGVVLLLIIWLIADGLRDVLSAPWWRGLGIGGLGFGFGSMLLLVGQEMSDPVTPAIAAAMMPITGAALEVILDGRRLRANLVTGMVLAISGGYLAAGAGVSTGTFGAGALLCFFAVTLFAWGTRATTREFPSLSTIGQTTVTLVGAAVVVWAVYAVCWLSGIDGVTMGVLDAKNWGLLLIFAWVSMSIAQILWIRAAGGLGILLASFHMNAVPFYVMVVVVVFLDKPWNSTQALGALLVATGVIVSQINPVRRQPV